MPHNRSAVGGLLGERRVKGISGHEGKIEADKQGDRKTEREQRKNGVRESDERSRNRGKEKRLNVKKKK